MTTHRPRTEDLGYGHGTMLVCAEDDQPWPCDDELQLRQEPPGDPAQPLDLLEPGRPAGDVPGEAGVQPAPADPQEGR